jgi:type II secretory pathway predicted ATPase ExeA
LITNRFKGLFVAFHTEITRLSTEARQRSLFQAMQGLPRKVNRTAHYALSAAALTKTKLVSAEHLHAALEELKP